MSIDHNSLGQPLKGKRVIVTRAQEQAEPMIKALEGKGAIPYLFPLIQTRRAKDLSRLDQALRHIDKYSWVIFTSVNTVDMFMQRSEELFGAVWANTELQNVQIAAVGPKTKRRLQAHGVPVEFIPSMAKQEELAAELSERIQPGQHVLFPKGNLARQHLKEVLEKHFIYVDDVTVYETVSVPHTKQQSEIIVQKLVRNDVDVLTFTSSSSVKHFIEWLESTGMVWETLLSSVAVACIGPVTAQTAEEYGLTVHVQADPYTVESLVAKLEEYYRGRKQV